MKKHYAFTLLEVIVAIVVLAILAALAVPRFVNFSREANTALMQNIAANLNTAMTFVTAKKNIQGATDTLEYAGNTLILSYGFPAPSTTQMRVLLDMDLPTTKWTPNWLSKPCQGSDFCFVGNRPFYVSTTPKIPGFNSGKGVFFWPEGYVLSGCFAYYINLENNLPPLIGFVDDGC